MRLNLSRCLLAAIFAAGAVGSAHAVNLVEVAGANIKFYYDADFWGLGSATVVGNSISFALVDDFTINAKSRTPTAINYSTYGEKAVGALFAVANDGYLLRTSFTQTINGNYSLAPGNSRGEAGVRAEVAGGTGFSGGKLKGAFSLGEVYGNYLASSYQAPAADNYSVTKQLFSAPNNTTSYFNALQFDPQLSVLVRQVGIGSSDMALTGLTYNFVVAVPEPETYAMMIAGLGLMGFVARRRKQNA